MKKVEVLLAGVLAISPALFAQQSASQPNSQSTASQSTQTSGAQSSAKSTSKASLTADQKAELKQLKTKAKEACTADKKSDACKSAKQDLRAKMDEYGVKRHAHHKGMKTKGSSTQSPS